MQKCLFVFYCFFVLVFTTNAQVGREFWFVAPDITVGHGDKPIVFRITALNTDANVTVSMPANGGKVIKNINIGANTQEKITLDKDVVENHPSDRVNNKGMLITSDADITVYYEVSNGVNPDKFTLKGSNALGKEFFIPSQNNYRNRPLNPRATEKVDIVAAEDNTTITITPSAKVIGHKANVPYTITLNKGQTYCIENHMDKHAELNPPKDDPLRAEKLAKLKLNSLAGTYVSSDKNIAVTISDDSIWQGEGFGPYDLIGDQLIPTSVIGTEYIAVKTNPDDKTINKLYVLATQDDTHISVVYNSEKVSKKLNKGEQVDLDIKGNALYVDSDKPIYAYQLASLWNSTGNEMGSAVLPSTNCTGSSTVSFVRTFTLEFWVQLLTQKKNLNSFILRDQNGNVLNGLKGVTWEKVVGTDNGADEETWYSGVIQLNITTGAPHTIENTNGLFHISILDENQGSTSYGYFSSYGQLRLEGPTQECEGNEIILRTAQPMKSYNWFSEHTGHVVQSTDPTFAVSQSGTYWVQAEVNFGGCIQTDSIEVEFLLPEFELGPDTTVCPDETITFTVPGGLGKYEWFDGSTGNTTSVVLTEGDTEDVWLTVTDDFNCSNTDRKQVDTHPVPVINLDRTEVCRGERIVADDTGIERFEWSFNGSVIKVPQNQNYIEPQVSGAYSLTVWGAEGCPVTQDFNVVVNALPAFNMADQLGCEMGVTTISAPLTGAGYTYLWSDGSTGVNLAVDTPDDYWLEITDANGCKARDEFNFDFLPPKPFDLGGDREECAGITLVIDQGDDYTNYEWSFRKDGETVIKPIPGATGHKLEIINATEDDHSGQYYVTAIDLDGCALADDVHVSFVDTPDPTVWLDQPLCEGKEIEVSVSTGYTNYTWWRTDLITGVRTELTGNKDKSTILVDEDGKYEVIAGITIASGLCTKVNEIQVNEYKNPSIELNDPLDICPESSRTISVNSFTKADGDFDYLVWNTSERRFKNLATAQLEVDRAGTYEVIAYDKLGCSATDNVTVGEFAKTNIGLGDPIETCENVKVPLKNPIVTARSYNWYKINMAGDTHLIADADWLTSETGAYRLQIEDANGCESADTIVVNALTIPVVDLGPDREMCEGDIITLAVDPTFVSYRWNGDNNLNKPSLQVSTTSNYRLEVTNIDGCTAEDNVLITANPLPNIVVADVAECAGEMGTLTAPTGLTNFRWSNGATTPSITVTKGTYTLSAESDKGCVGEAIARVDWYPVPTVSIGADTAICPIDIIPLEASPGYDYYEWHNGDIGRFTYADFSDTVNVVTVRDEHGCWGFDSRMVHSLPAPDYELCPDTAVCTGDTIVLEAGYDFIDYRWFDDSRLPTYTVRKPGKYWVSVLDGCFWLQDTTTVVYNETPVIAQIDTLIYGQIGVLAEGGTEPYKYALNDEEWQELNLFKDLENGTYIVQVRDINKCMALDTVLLNSIVDIDVPNFFTPNNDGFNDRWELDGMEKFPDSIIKIYDRFGKLLIEYKASEPGWDGEYIGKPVPSDAYWYVIEVLPLRKLLKGHITLKR